MDHNRLASATRRCLQSATTHSFEMMRNEHWCGELRSNVTITAEYVFLHQVLGSSLERDRDSLCRWLLSQQKKDGSWGIAPNHIGDVSITIEAYLALKILKTSVDEAEMQQARQFIITAGGKSEVRVLTRFYLATFGLWPWDSIPELPAELILMPTWVPVNIYRLSSWVRSTCIPMLVVSHHRPIFALPNGRSVSNDYLSELWVSDDEKTSRACIHSSDKTLQTDMISWLFALCDKAVRYLNGLRLSPTRAYARRKCVSWILEHQEPEGDWGGIFPPMHLSILALLIEGYKPADKCIRLGLEAIERFGWEDDMGKRIQTCISPVWDTFLMTIGLIDAGIPSDDERLKHAMQWIQTRQDRGLKGDWRIYSGGSKPGGFAFEYFNSWYPDLDDTAEAVICFLKQDCDSGSSEHVLNAVEWMLDMQNTDGGWAAFDVDNNKMYLNKLPFADMDNLCDPSSPDVSGHVLEALGLLSRNKSFHSCHMYGEISRRMDCSASRAIQYLTVQQEEFGGWYGRWGCNYIYGTSCVLCGLAQWMNSPSAQKMVQSGITWLKTAQNGDGGFGESLNTYHNPDLAGQGRSSATQTAWALMGLLAHLEALDNVIKVAVTWLIANFSEQRVGGTWQETDYTSTGFPRFFYIQYSLYPHYFPLMALGRFLATYEREHGDGASVHKPLRNQQSLGRP